jgi:hypothetical protein
MAARGETSGRSRAEGRVRRSAFVALLVAAGGWGFALALALTPAFTRPAPSGQTPGHMTDAGLDAAGPFEAMAACVLLPGLAALLARPLALRLAARDSAPWVSWLAAGCWGAGLWARLATSTSLTTLVLTGLAPMVLLALRRRPLASSRYDLLLAPTFLVAFHGLVDALPGLPVPETALAAAAAVALLRLLVGLVPRPGRPPAWWCFALAPVAQLLHVHALHAERAWAAPLAPALATGSVLALAFLARWDEGRALRWRRLVAFAALPLFAVALPASSGRWWEPLLVNLFEDGHHVMPAAEMLRGERLYRDAVPGHGALADGGISWAAMRLFGERLDVALLADHYLGTLDSLAAYALGFAATGSPMAGLGTLLFAQAAPSGAAWLRTAASLGAVAFAMAAARRRDPRRLLGAGACVAAAFLTSLEMGLYAAAVVLLAALRAGTWAARGRWLVAAAAGGLAVAVPAGLVLLARGTLDDMARVTGEMLSLGPVYVLGLEWLEPALGGRWALPEAVRLLAEPAAAGTFLWAAAVVATAAGLAASPLRGRRPLEPLLLLGGWVAVAGFSLAERHHEYFTFGLWPLLAVATAVLLRSRRPARRVGGVAAVLALLVVAGPSQRLWVEAHVQREAEPPAAYASLPGVPRAGAALFAVEDRRLVEGARRALDELLGPGETFYDFVDRPILYFLLDRPSPVRQPEVAFYQGREAQLEVVDRLRGDDTVRAALVGVPMAPIDEVPNCRRAPHVWWHLDREFRRAWAADGIEVWQRTPPRGEGEAASAAWRQCLARR